MSVTNEATIRLNAVFSSSFKAAIERFEAQAIEMAKQIAAADVRGAIATASAMKQRISQLQTLAEIVRLDERRVKLSDALGRKVGLHEVKGLEANAKEKVRIAEREAKAILRTNSSLSQQNARERQREIDERARQDRINHRAFLASRVRHDATMLSEAAKAAAEQARLEMRQAKASLARQKSQNNEAITEARRAAKAIQSQRSEFYGFGGNAGVGAMQARGLSQVGALMSSGGASGLQNVAAQGAYNLRQFQFKDGAMVGGPVAALAKVERQAKQTAAAVGEIGTRGKFAVRVLEAFVLYRGFVMLQQGAMSATRSMIDLEKQVALVQTQLSGGVGRAVITDRIMDVANTTGLAFADVAKAEYSVVSANIALGDSWRVLDLSAKAAVAGGLADVQTAFNAALAQVNAFGLGVEEFGRVYDLQFNLVKRGIFTYEQLANIVGEVSLAFANAGQDIETANSAIAAISQIFTGPQITEGATALKRLANQIAQTPEAFEKMGIAVADSDGNYRNFILILEDLKAALAGMSQTESQKVLHEMFPDERELRGARGALQTLDAMKDIYIEQQLALGDMEDKFKDVADTMDTRLGQLRNNMQEGFGTATDIFGGLLKAMNEMEKVLPGLTASMVSFGAAAAMVGIVGSYATGASVGHPGMSRAGAFRSALSGPISPGFAGAVGMKYGQQAGNWAARGISPMAFGGYIMGGAIASGVGAGETGGPSMGGFATAVGSSTALGALGGLPGMAIGATVGTIAYLFSSIEAESKEKARLAARSFTEAITEELGKSGGDVGKALDAMRTGGATAEGRNAQDILIGLGAVSHETLGASKSEIMFGNYDDLSQRRRALFKSAMTKQMMGKGTGGEVNVWELAKLALSSGFAAESDAKARRPELMQEAILRGETPEQAGVLASQQEAAAFNLTVRDAMAIMGEEGAVLATELGGLGMSVRDGKIAQADATNVLRILAVEGIGPFHDALKLLPVDLAKVAATTQTSFGELAKTIEKMGPNWQLASDVFAELGDEGKKLAAVFARVAAIADGFGKLKSLSELIIPGTPNAPLAPGRLDFRMYKEPDRNVMTESGINVGNVASIMQGELNRTLDRIQAMSGMGRDAAMAEYLMRGPAAEKTAMAAFEIPGATPLGEQLEAAAEMVASGFIPSLGFTADQLMGFSREFNDINRAIAKMNLLGEFQRLGVTLFGMPEDYMRGAMTTLLGSMQVGAEDLRSLFQDPTRLAELLASSFEFGDIQVDQSTNNNYVIRISGDIDSNPNNLAKIADGIIQQINIKSREAKRR